MLGFASAWLLRPAPPLAFPEVTITPSQVTVEAGQRIAFAASGRHGAGAAPLGLRWAVSGLAVNASPIARCVEQGTTLDCAFLLPGTFAVTLEATDDKGLSAISAASVEVRVPGGYLAVFAPYAEAPARQALFYDVDWSAVQAAAGRPVVIEHPEGQYPVYAIHAAPPPGTPDPPPWRGAAAGTTVAIAGLSAAGLAAVAAALERVGAVVVPMPAAEVTPAVVRGAVAAVLVPVDGLSDLQALIGEFR